MTHTVTAAGVGSEDFQLSVMIWYHSIFRKKSSHPRQRLYIITSVTDNAAYETHSGCLLNCISLSLSHLFDNEINIFDMYLQN